MACLGNKFTAIDDPNNIEGFVQCVEIRIVELKKATSKRERKNLMTYWMQVTLCCCLC